MSSSIEAMVIGAGVVGLAVARQLAQQGREVIVLERNGKIGQETSSRNSGVIHSGIYYPHGSHKALLCVRGRELLYDYCVARGIAHRRVGKIIVAQTEEVAALRSLQAMGERNGVSDLRWMDAAEVSACEPLVRCAAGLFSPSTGIVDAHEYMIALHGDIEAAGGTVVFSTAALSMDSTPAGIAVVMRSGNEPMEFTARCVINAAGLDAVGLLDRIGGYPAQRKRQAFFAKGNYFTCSAGRPFRHLVYPMPNEAGLGVHATLGLDGTTRFGPDVEWVDGVNYEVGAERADKFYAAIRRYWPDIPPGALQPAYAGIRPKLAGAAEKAADFLIEGAAMHGVPGLINLLGIESPGLTSSLAIAEYVSDELERSGAWE